jgi:clan AA aspartic protease (TIGR02281 family)
MKRKGGNLWVPVQINKAVAIDFVVDSGASDVLIPKDVFLTLVRSGTITQDDYIGKQTYNIADGSEVKGVRFKLSSLQVGNQILTNVEASIMPSDSASPLLGLSFLSRFKSWTIDNDTGTLMLTLPGQNSAPGGPPVQVASTAATPATGPNSSAASQANAGPGAPEVTRTQETTPALAGPPAPVGQTAATPATVQSAATEGPNTANPNATNSATGPSQPAAGAPTLLASTAPELPHKQQGGAGAPTFPANTAYAEARRSLMALGYEPAPLPSAEKCDRDTDKTCFPERETCARDGRTQCEFFWKRGDRLIKVTTIAVPPTVSSVGCQANCE